MIFFKTDKYNFFKTFGIIFFLLLIVSSCISTKKLKYIQTKDKDNVTNEFIPQKKVAYKIQPNDDLYIKVTSLDEETYKFFNKESGNRQYMSNDASIYLNSYTVNDSGYVNFPFIGKILVKDLTIEQTKDLIQKYVNEYLNQATVFVKLVNYNITILGEVKKPGIYTVYNDKVNIMEALGFAGDLTDYGNRKNITLIRQTNQGSIVNYIDLTDKKILQSEYYFLMPGDIIYAQPMRAKSLGLRTFPFATLLSTITTLILVLNYIK